MSKTTVYTIIPREMSASNYYRQRLPLGIMEKLGLPIEALVDDMTTSISNLDRFGIAQNANIALMYHCISEGYVNFLEQLDPMPAMRDKKGDLRWPPCVISDTDDDLFTTEPSNPAFLTLGIAVNGKPMKKGQRVVMRDSRGDTIRTWHDGVNFDLAANLARLECWRKNLRLSHLITCATPGAEAHVLREIPDAKTYVFPNSINFDEYVKCELAEHPDEVRILWQGGDSHFPDLLPIHGALKNVAEKYGKRVKWPLFGQKYQWLENLLGNVEYIPWVPYQSYKLRLTMLGHDINLCPLRDVEFNASKSAIKFYESAAIWNPAASLASNVGPYKEIIEGETGLLYNSAEELETKLCGLIEDAQLRKTLAANAKDWLKTNRDIYKTAPPLYNAYMETLTEYRANKPISAPKAEEPVTDAQPMAAGNLEFEVEEGNAPPEPVAIEEPACAETG